MPSRSKDAPLHFVTTTTAPHLPFEDDYFDLVYCGSVFTHISDLADAWLLEIRRILRTGAYAYITIHDNKSVRLLQVFYNLDYLVGHWSPFMEVRSVTEAAHDYQAVLVLRKRRSDAAD
jgi:ubiquinone/menaquinone biosynthesis C-methylase UbiE